MVLDGWMACLGEDVYVYSYAGHRIVEYHRKDYYTPYGPLKNPRSGARIRSFLRGYCRISGDGEIALIAYLQVRADPVDLATTS